MADSGDDAAAGIVAATDQLWDWRRRRLTLQRPLILVAGLSDEDGQCWAGFEQLLPEVLTNYGTHVHLLEFTDDGGSGVPQYDDFLGFGADIAR